MNYALDQFTLTDGQIFMVQGANSLYTYQNLGSISARIQGSNDAIQWSDIGELAASKTLIQEHSYKYLRSTGQTTVSVNRGEGNNSNDGSGGTGDAIPLTEKGQPNGVATLNSSGKVPLNQLPPITGGGNGQGFIFDELTNYTTEVVVPATMGYFSMGADPILTGNTTVGSIRPGNAQSAALGYFKAIQNTSYKMRLFPNTTIQVIATQRKIDFSDAGPVADPIGDAGGKGPVILNIGDGYIDTNVENQDIHLEFQTEAEDWLEITQTGSELIWRINGTEAVRTPQDSADNWFTVVMDPTFDDSLPVSIFQYDLTGTIAKISTEVDLSALTDMVIYHASQPFKILDKHIEVGDYVQLYDDQSKLLIYPQLSKIYDFDVSSPENLSFIPVTLHNHNPFITLTESTEAGKWQIGLPHQEVSFVDFSDASPETLESFSLDMSYDIPRLTLNSDHDPEGVLEQVVAEFKITKDWIYSISTLSLSTGTASHTNFYFYAGADRDKNYLRLTFIKYPTYALQLRVADAAGVERLIQETNNEGTVRINLKDHLSILFLGTDDLQGTVSENAGKYTKLFDFSDSDTKITVKATFEAEEEAITNQPWLYMRPLQNANILIQKSDNYNNVTPIEIVYGSGLSTFKFEKQKSVAFYFVAANSLSEVCNSIVNNPDNLAVGYCIVHYNASEDKYNFTLNSPNGTSQTGEYTLSPTEEITLSVTKTPSSFTLKLKDLSMILSGSVKDKLFIGSAGPMLGRGLYLAQTVHADLRNIQGPSKIKLDAINARDRIRIIGGKATIHNKAVNSGDIVEFFNNKTESLVTPNQKNSLALQPLVVRNSSNNIVKTIRAFYDTVQQRITLSGTIYFSNYDYRVAIYIEVPQEIVSKLSTLNSVGFFGPARFFSNGLPILNTAYGDTGIELTLGYTSGAYVSGDLVIPDATVAISN